MRYFTKSIVLLAFGAACGKAKTNDPTPPSLLGRWQATHFHMEELAFSPPQISDGPLSGNPSILVVKKDSIYWNPFAAGGRIEYASKYDFRNNEITIWDKGYTYHYTVTELTAGQLTLRSETKDANGVVIIRFEDRLIRK